MKSLRIILFDLRFLFKDLHQPLTEVQTAGNKEKSIVRAQFEQFGFKENIMNGSFVDTIGIAKV
jgi:hypothetical protein